MFDNLEELDNLSQNEKELVLKILDEYSSKGSSNIYNELLLSDYKEVPVDIVTFIKDDRYLGRAWHTASGKCKLYEFWEEKLKEIFPDAFTTNYNNLIESGARGIGKAQPLDSLVLAESGYIKMKDIQVDSLVYGNDGKLHKVLGVFPQGKKDVYKITFSDNTSTLCCKEHLWEVKNKYSDNFEVVTLEELLEDNLFDEEDIPIYSIPNTKAIEFKNKFNEYQTFILGFILGKSSSTRNNIDKNYILNIVNYLFPTDFPSKDDLYNSVLEYIKSLNLLDINYLDLYIPNIYKHSSVEDRLNLLKGFLSAVEYDFIKKNPIFLKDGKLIEDLIFIVQSLGGFCIKHILTKEELIYDDGITSVYLYPQFPLDIYKIFKAEEYYIPLDRYIINIEYFDSLECQCIYLDSKEHLYLTNDFIVTHNSEIAVTVGLYLMHRLMCLKNPHEFLNLKPTEKVCFAFMNITMALAEDVGISKFQETVKLSPWFMDRGHISGRDIKIWNPPDFIDVILGSQSSHLVGRPIFFAFFDEISFIKNMDISKQKKIAMDMIDTAIGGMKTRFIHKGKNPTMLILASSKRTDKSFLEEHMKKKLRDEDESALIIDEPVWNIKPKETYSGNKFYVAQGNRFLSSEIIPDGDDLKDWKNKGYKILDVPVEFKSDFKDDIDRALCDFAGVSSSELTKYISGNRLAAIRSLDYKNPFIKEILEVGNALDDTAQYYDFFDMSRIDKSNMDRPLFVHLDMSLTGDKTGISGVWILGKKRTGNSNSAEELYFKLAFAVSIKAPKGYQISFAKNREFIYWLKRQGFIIKGVSTDTYQNASLAQDLLSNGYPYEVVSVDRVDSQSKTCKPYAYFKNCIYEQRLKIFDCELLTEELLALERNESSGKVDHPDSGSKDMSDAVCGALYNASSHGDEFAFYYGEDIENTISASTHSNMLDRKQLEIDMESELNRLFDPLRETVEQQVKNDSFGLDFGFGKASENYKALYLSQGIVI